MADNDKIGKNKNTDDDKCCWVGVGGGWVVWGGSGGVAKIVTSLLLCARVIYHDGMPCGGCVVVK